MGSEKSLMLPEVDYYYQIVGFYEPTYKIDPWWQEPISSYEQEFIVDYNLFIGYYINHHSAMTSAQWRYVLDYTQLEVDNIENFANLIKSQTKYFDRYRATNAELNSAEILFAYFTRENQLTLTLLVLQMPQLIMLAFYLFMVSQIGRAHV